MDEMRRLVEQRGLVRLKKKPDASPKGKGESAAAYFKDLLGRLHIDKI